MFSIENTNDIEILKELIGFSNNQQIQVLEKKVEELTQANVLLEQTTMEQKRTIEKLSKNLVTPKECRDIVFDLIENRSKPQNLSRSKKVSIIKQDTDEFDLFPTMEKKFNKVIVDGNKLIHYTVRNQKMNIPVSTLELLALMEIYQHRQRKLLNKDATNICKLFNLSKVQFGKLYYNIKEGTFFNALQDIDKQIKATNFKIINDTIYIVEGGKSINTEISVKVFKKLLDIYANSNQPYSTIYKLSREYKQINPVYLLTVLKRNTVVSKAL